MSQGSPASDLANSAASPAYRPITEDGTPISCSASEMTDTASLSAAFGARSKLMVTAGNCSWCEMTSGAVVYWNRATAFSGTCAAPDVASSGVGDEPAVSEVCAETAWLPAAGT